MNQKTVLVVEDDARSRHSLCEHIASIGDYEILQAENVPQAMSLLNRSVDMAILDLSLPVAEGLPPTLDAGLVIAQELHSQSIPFIVISAIAGRPEVQKRLLATWPLSVSEKDIDSEKIRTLILVSERVAQKVNKLSKAADRSAMEAMAATVLSCRLAIPMDQARKHISKIPQQERTEVCTEIAASQERLVAMELKRGVLQGELSTVEGNIRREQQHLQSFCQK